MVEGGGDERASGGTPAVFISYASQDAAVANSIVENLEQQGLRCWLAPRDVKPGAQYADAIVAAINEAKAVVLLLSQDAMASSHVSREVERAASKHKPIIAFRIDPATLNRTLEYFLSESQWIDVPAIGMPAALAKLAEAVEQGSGQTVAAVPVASAKPLQRTGRRAKLIAGAAVVISVAVAAAWGVRFWSQSHKAAQPTAAMAITDKSIAVLPFVDMSEKKDQEYFSDGLSEELIELLGQTPGLRVIARTSSFYFKGRTEKLETIAEELHVANVLEGSVRKSGDRLRVTAQLIRADTSEHLWSETFDRDLHDVFKVQDEIATAVVTALKVHLLPMQKAAGQAELRTENLEAYNLYLQGRQSYNQGDVAGYKRAVTAFQAAIALDPRYAVAYADLALAQFWLTDSTDPGESDVELDSALAAAEKAVALAPGLAAGYSARGFLRAIYRFDFAGGQADLAKAVALGPGDAWVLHRSAVLLGVLGKLSEAIAREEQALALDPLSEEICRRLAFFLVANQQLAQARPLYEKALVIAPNSIRARYNLGELELLENQPERALAIYRQLGDSGGQARAEYSLGHVDVSQRILEEFIATKGGPFQIASVYAWRGEKDKAFEWAERAYAQRDSGLTWLKIDTNFRSLRGDPRYKALLRKMHLPE
jgi:TolB-like protein